MNSFVVSYDEGDDWFDPNIVVEARDAFSTLSFNIRIYDDSLSWVSCYTGGEDCDDGGAKNLENVNLLEDARNGFFQIDEIIRLVKAHCPVRLEGI